MIHGLSRVFLPFWCLDAKGGEISEGFAFMHGFHLHFRRLFIAFALVELYVVCARGTFLCSWNLMWLCCGTLRSLLYEMDKLLYESMDFGIRIYLWLRF